MDRSNLILEQQVTERTREIERQKEELALSNEEILDSIKYAKRIQEAILPTAKQISSFLPDSFVLYRPKDVVSGDFYFIERATTTNENKSDYVIFSAIDCTGHGVPGAFMSIVGNNLLAQTLNDSTINNPSDALNFLNEGVYKTLRQSNADSQVRDGMDLAFCALNAEKGELMFSGAKNPVYIIRSKNLEPLLLNGEILTPKVESDIFCLYEVKGDKQPVGNNSGFINAKFTNHIIKVIPNDMVYVFTDGYADQFGGPKNKKYNYTRFRQFLLSIASFSSKKQGELLERELIEWQGDFFQIDDVLVLGVRV
jgi:serine phosphatase RsbU (regulator of sigma subunit)